MISDDVIISLWVDTVAVFWIISAWLRSYPSVQAYLHLDGCYHLARDCFCLRASVGSWYRLDVECFHFDFC